VTPTEHVDPLSNEDKINVLDGNFNEGEAMMRRVTEIDRNREFSKAISHT